MKSAPPPAHDAIGPGRSGQAVIPDAAQHILDPGDPVAGKKPVAAISAVKRIHAAAAVQRVVAIQAPQDISIPIGQRAARLNPCRNRGKRDRIRMRCADKGGHDIS